MHVNPSNGRRETRSASATYFIPSEDEWYKAAYYDPRMAAAGVPPGTTITGCIRRRHGKCHRPSGSSSFRLPSNGSGGFNLVGTGNAVFNQTGDQTGVTDPMLGSLQDNGGPTFTHGLLVGSPAIDAGNPTAMAGVGSTPEFDQRGAPFGRIEDSDGDSISRIDIGALELQQSAVATCDFNGINGCDIEDIDALVTEIVAGTNNLLFDLTDDDLVDLADRDQWLADAGALNLVSGNAYLLGDSNLDGVVDGQDFIVWNANKFTSTGKWSQADWNADGVTDGQDFIAWNLNKFQSSDERLTIAPRLPQLSSTIESTDERRIDAVFAAFHSRNEYDGQQLKVHPFEAVMGGLFITLF